MLKAGRTEVKGPKIDSSGSWARTAALVIVVGAAATVIVASGCRQPPPANSTRVSGQVDATAVHVAAEVGGRVLAVPVSEGDRVAKGGLIAQIDTRDTDLALRRAHAERDQADAQLRLLLAGSRAEDIRQAQAQIDAAAGDVAAASADLRSADTDLERFEKLLASRSGSGKQRDDALTRRDVARERVTAARARERAAREGLARTNAGARPQEIDAARAHVASADAQIATLEKAKSDATLLAPMAGLITEKLLDPGDMAVPRAPVVVLTDLDHAWAEVFVGEPQVPRIKLGQAATVFTDAGGAGLAGTVSFVSPKAEFTPRNVQTADDRSKLVYRVKISVNNRGGVLKQGMPVEAEIPLQ
jgi:HlyD family secretion protein